MRFTFAFLVAALMLGTPSTPVSAQPSIRPLTLVKLDQFIKGLEAEKAFWTPIWAKDRRTVDSLSRNQPQFNSEDPYGFEKKRNDYEACEEAVGNREPGAAAFEAKLEADMKKLPPEKMREFGMAMQELGMRAERAQASGDLAAMNRVIDEMGPIYAKHLGVNSATMTQMMKRVAAATLKECGKPPVRLTREQQDSIVNAQNEAQQVTLVSDTLTSDVGMRVSGLGDNYALLRELLVMYFSSGADSSPMTPDGFNNAERAVIRQRAAKLKSLFDFLDSRGGLDS